ncbi:branched-chain amino acid ABC transporter permease [Anaeropeptidivorans aminofermentans]|jgi:branched-chain amino acid transport system permease protein|uniref:branched-chain amino acid ABC transporter permease n=1 Tax=Anaeropeptidivorans aminofermentans TaxID=2934315 RepID=UPI0020242160|nr:branched-chain amino acid ABC transporter permease [Anaeropeptidivorans aminofermentans]MBE6011206.1 branched-chain amino acid ABC transporter permease [Lachnospiraceae bacterium]
MNKTNKNLKSKRNIVFIVIIIAVLLCSFAGDSILDSYAKRILNLCAIYTIIALSMNLVNGFTGQFSLGQAGFMAIGAYVVGIFTLPIEYRDAIFFVEPMLPAIKNIYIPLLPALLLGGALSAVFAFFIGLPVLRLRGDYLAIATLGFSEIIRIVLTNAQSVTNGALGIKDIPTMTNMFYIHIVLIVTIVFMALLINSSYGRAFKAIREDEIAAQAMGVSLLRHKLLAFIISAFIAGVGGGLTVVLIGTVDPKAFIFTFTYNFLLMIVLGGMGSITGTVIASYVVTIALEQLRFFDEPLSILGMNLPFFRPGLRMLMFSLLLLIIVLFFPNGIMGNRELSLSFLKEKWSNIKSRFHSKKGGEVS